MNSTTVRDLDSIPQPLLISQEMSQDTVYNQELIRGGVDIAITADIDIDTMMTIVVTETTAAEEKITQTHKFSKCILNSLMSKREMKSFHM